MVLYNIQELLGIVAHAFNSSILETDAGELLWVQGQSGLQSKTLSQKQKGISMSLSCFYFQYSVLFWKKNQFPIIWWPLSKLPPRKFYSLLAILCPQFFPFYI